MGEAAPRFASLAPHEFRAALQGMEAIEQERQAWQISCSYLRDRQGLVAGERIRILPADEAGPALLELDTLHNLILLPDGSVRQTTAGQAWEISERVMEMV